MNATDLFALLWMLPFAFMAWLVIRHHLRAAKRRQATAFDARLSRYHAGINARHHLTNRSGCVCAELLFPLALAAFFIATGLAAWIAADEITRRF